MWTPVDCEETRTDARACIREIAEELHNMENGPLSVFDLCEHALLYAYMGLDQPTEDWHARSLACLNLAIDQFSNLSLSEVRYGLYGGLTGFGWMVQHVSSILAESAVIDAAEDSDEDDPLIDLDRLIFDLQKSDKVSTSGYDLINGLVGVGVYWLERLPRSVAHDGLRHAVYSLEDICEITPSGVTWLTTPVWTPDMLALEAPNGYYNLGVAHGVPGVIGFLTQVASASMAREVTDKASALLAGAMKWLLAQQHPITSSSRYSKWIIPGEDPNQSGMAWCYGDLGIAAVLQIVAVHTPNPLWISEANSLIARCLSRSLRYRTKDASLCHGALGIAHIYNRMFQLTRMEVYGQAVIDWTRKGLALRKLGLGPGGYYSWIPESFPHEQSDASFLTGAVGAALALLSIISSIEPHWDRLLLLSEKWPAIIV
jgi:lantibiotic biosynthesis protein